MIITTERLILKQASENDALFYFQLFNDEDFINNIHNKNLKSEAETLIFLRDTMIPNFCKNGLGFFTVFEKNSMVAVGTASILKREKLEHLDVGYAFLPNGRGKGYAVEATKRIMNYAKYELTKDKVFAFTNPSNEASQRVLHKIGFNFIGAQEVFKGEKDHIFEYIL